MAGQVISRLTSSGGNDAGVHVISSSFYGTCSSAANTENKEVIIQNRNVEQVNLTKGMLLTVKFTNENDYSESLPSLQLFKNEAAPDSVPIAGSALTNPMTIFAQQNNNIKPNWSAGSVVTFIYDTYTKQNQDDTTSTLGCWIKTAGLSEEIFDNLNIRIDGVESASTIAINGVADRVDSIESNITQAAVIGDIEFIYWPIDSTTTPPVTPAASYDWEETFNVNCEWSTDALSYVFGLDIWQRTKSFTIGNASNPTYSDPIRITGRDGAKGDKGDQGEPGTTGSPAYSYDLVTNVTSLTRNVNTSPVVNNPNNIIFSATKTEGNNAPIDYSGQLVISEYVYDDSTSKWIWRQLREKSLMDSQSIEITPSIAATLVRGILFTVDGVTQLDSQTIPIIETGLNGSSVTVDSIQYGTSETETATPQSWNVTVPSTITPGWWLWTKTSYVGVATPAVSKSYIGTDGEDGKSVTVQSINKDGKTTTVVLDKGDGTTTSMVITDGTDGENGQPGAAGEDGKSSYVHFAWANSADGQTSFTPSQLPNTEYLYMGVYTDENEEDSLTYSDYSWTLIKGSDGEDGNDAIIAYLTNESYGFAATASAAVTASVSSQFIVNQGGQELQATIKEISADPTTSSAVTAGALTTTYSNNTFTISINPSFTTTAYAHSGTFAVSATASVNGSSQEFIKDFSWSLVPAGADGENGVNVSNVKLYKIAMSTPGTPTGDITYSFNDQTVTGSLNGWSISVPDMSTATAGASCYLISANVLAPANQSTDVIQSGEWYGPIVYTKNGKDGIDGKDGTNGLDAYNRASISLYQRSSTTPAEPSTSINYTFSTGTLTPSDALGNWTTGVAAAVNGEPCWVINANAISDSAVYTITDWSNPVIFTRDGADGEGVSITNREIHYIESTSGTVTPADNAQWEVTIPSVAEGKYLWTRTKVTYSDGNTLTSYSVAKQGEGITVTSSSIEYATNNSTTTPTSGWQNTPPSTTPGWYIWTKTTTNYSDGSTVTSYSVGKTGTNGSNAYLYELQCNPSVIMLDQTVETPSFSPTAITLSATKTEGNNTPVTYTPGRYKLEWTNNGTDWTAVASSGDNNTASLNCSITAVSTAATAFRATLYKSDGYTDILDTEDIPVIKSGTNGIDGTNGINGYNQAAVYLYQRSTNQPTNKPSNSLIYNFANKTLTPTENYTPTWSLNQVPAENQNNDPAWMIFAMASSTASEDSITSTEWSTPIRMEGIDGIDGEDGYNQTIVSLYQRATSIPTTQPTGTTYYTFTNNSLTPGTNFSGWSLSIPSGTNPCWITSALARSQTVTATIASSAWSGISKFVEDGKSGYNNATIYIYQRADSSPSVPNTELTYTFDSCSLNLPQDSLWSQEIPEKTEQNNGVLWMTAAVANSTAATDTIASTDWSEVIQLEGVNGISGQAGYNQATIQLYKRADASPSASMPGTLTYTFSDGSLTPKDSGSTDTTPTYNGWYKQIPTIDGKPCWVTSGTAISRDSTTNISNWNTPTKMLEDSINVIIDNDNITFPTTNGAAAKTTVTCSIKAFKGLTQVPCTIGNISGTVTGITTTITTQGSTTTPTAKVTITASNTTSTLLTTEQGTLTIPITVSGVTDSINKQFTWSLAKNGLNQATVYLYKRANAVTTPTSGAATYTFSSKTLTIPTAWGTGNNNLGWLTSFPEETQGSITPVWVMTAIASSNTDIDDNIAHTEWSTPVKWVSSGSNGQDGEDGEDAYNQADIFLYRRSTDTPIKPVFSNFTYTFSTGVGGLTTSYATNASPSVTWYTSVTAATVTSGNSQNDYMPCWMTTTHPVSQNASVTVTNTWSDPVIFIQPGKGIADITECYLATTASTGVTTNTSGWNTSLTNTQISTTTPYLWNYEVTTYTDKTTRTIAPHIIATYGEKGNAGKGISSIINYYQTTETATAPSSRYESTTTSNGWIQCPPNNIPQVTSTNKYLWNYEKVTYTEGDPTFTDIHLVGAYGDNGVGITSIEEQQILWPYDDSDTSTHPGPGDDANWQPKGSVIWESGKYIWSQTKITWTNGNIDYVGRAVAKDINDLNKNLIASKNWYATSDTAAGTVEKIATISPATTAFTLTNGAMVNIVFSNTNSAAVGSLTLNVNSTGDKPIKYIYNNSLSALPGANYLKQGIIYQFIYDGTNWVAQNIHYNTNNYDRRLHNNYIKAIESVNSGKLVCGTSNGYKAIAAGVSFDIAYPILWAGGAWTANTQYSNAYEAYPSVNPNTTGTVENIAINKMVWLRGEVSGSTFTIASSNFLTCTVPVTEDGYYYLPLGIIANDSTTKMYFSTSDKLYTYLDEAFQRVDLFASNKAEYVENLLPSISDEITKTQETLNNNAVIETNQWWFITDKKETPGKPDEQSFNSNTGDYDNWMSKVSDSYITIDPENPPDRYSISNNIVIDEYDDDRDVTEFCITVKEDNKEIIWKYYPYNYYCYEYKYLNGAIAYSDVVYDSVKSSIAENKIIEDHQNKALEELMYNQNQFFYSDTNGAHVKDTESNYETTWNSSGMSFYKADSKLLTILAMPDDSGIYSGMTIYNGKTGDEEKIIARFIPNLIQLGSDKEDRLRITREQIEFIKDSIIAAYIGTNGFYTPNITIDSSLYLETPKESIESQDQDKEYKWAWIPRSNGNIAFKWVGTPIS